MNNTNSSKIISKRCDAGHSVTSACKKFGIYKLQQRLDKIKSNAYTDGSCLRVKNLKAAKQTGYIRVTIAKGSDPKNSMRVLLHHLALFLHRGSRDLQLGKQQGDFNDVSHLCNHKDCVNAQHLIVEKHSINLTRLCCDMFLGKQADYVCPHVENPCIPKQ